MEFSIWIKSVFKVLVLPPCSILIAAIIAVHASKRRAAARIVALCLLYLLAALCTPVVARLLVLALKPPATFDVRQVAGAGAIVLIGGGVRRDAPDYGGDTINALTLERVRYAARIQRITQLPLLVSGGSPQGGMTEGALMARALREEFSIPVTWIEDRSRNTHENAVFSSAILRTAGIYKVVLIAHSFDALRATAEFEAAGIAATPAATGLPSNRPVELLDFVPTMSGLQTSYYATYEIVANIVRWLIHPRR